MSLDRTIARFLWWDLVSSTRKTHDSIVNSYVKFCAFGKFQAFSPTWFCIVEWVDSLKFRRLKSKTIKTYITDLRFVCVDREYFDLIVFNEFLLQREINDIKRMYDESETRERKTITRDILLEILQSFDTRIRKNATLHVAFCLAFANFLRIDEFTWFDADRTFNFGNWFVTRSSMVFFDDHLVLTLFVSKIDPFRKEISILIAVTSDAVCAVISLRHLFLHFSVPEYVLLFQIEKSRTFSAQFVIKILRKAIEDLKHDDNYSKHSFRRGAAIEARNADVSNDLIQLLERWKSKAFLLYIEINKNYVLRASRHHQNDWTAFFFALSRRRRRFSTCLGIVRSSQALKAALLNCFRSCRKSTDRPDSKHQDFCT